MPIIGTNIYVPKSGTKFSCCYVIVLVLWRKIFKTLTAQLYKFTLQDSRKIMYTTSASALRFFNSNLEKIEVESPSTLTQGTYYVMAVPSACYAQGSSFSIVDLGESP